MYYLHILSMSLVYLCMFNNLKGIDSNYFVMDRTQMGID